VQQRHGRRIIFSADLPRRLGFSAISSPRRHRGATTLHDARVIG